ncbi:MAG: YfhO family protein [bacterium]|nr:YfhO family protein [bacterium]
MKRDLVCLFLILFSGILVNFPLFTGNIPFDFDNLAFYHPLFSLAQVKPLLLWDLYQFSGFPVFAEPQYAMFYPLRWLFNFVNVFPAMPIFYILHYVLGLGFMYLFLRSLKLGRIAATGGTFCFIHGSYLQAKLLMSGTLFFSMVWIPLFFLFAIRAIEKLSFRNTIYAGWVLGIIALIGSPHHLFYPVLAILIYILFNAFSKKESIKVKWLNRLNGLNLTYLTYLTLLLFLMVLIGISIGAIQLIPGQELFIRSIRANLTFDQLTETPLKTNWILGSFLGGTQTPEFLDASAYFGVAGLIFILFAFLRGRGEVSSPLNNGQGNPAPTQDLNNKTKLWFWLTIGILAIFIARGEYAPFYYIFYQLPFLKSLSFPCRSLILLAFAGSVLTAYGIDSAISKKSEIRSQKSEYVLFLTSCFLLLASIISLLLLYFRVGTPLIQTLIDSKWADPMLYRWANLAMFTFLTALALILYWKDKIGLRTFQFLILAIIFADLFHFTPRVHKRFINAKEYLTPPKAVEFLQKQLASSAQSAQSAVQEPTRFIGFEASRLYSIDQNDNRFKDYLAPKLGDLYRLQDAQGYDPLMLQRYVTLMQKMAGRSSTEDPQRMATVAECDPRFLNLLNIGYIVGEVNEFSIHRSPLILSSGIETTITVAIDTPCVELGLMSLLDEHLETPQETKIGTITVTGAKGEQETLPLRAGIETADWRTESTLSAHQMPNPAMTWIRYISGKEYTLHNYYSRLKFSYPLVPKEIRFGHQPIPGILVVQNVTLIKQNNESQFEKVADYGELRIYRNKTVYPRAFLVHQAEVIPNETELLATLANKTTDLRHIAYLEEPLPFPLTTVGAEPLLPLLATGRGSSRGQSLPKIVNYLPNEITIETDSPRNGFLVVSEIAYPGWQAFIDGKPAKLYTTDYILRGIYLEPGKHTIIFKFIPLSLYLGAGITLLTLLGSLLGIVVSKQ